MISDPIDAVEIDWGASEPTTTWSTTFPAIVPNPLEPIERCPVRDAVCFFGGDAISVSLCMAPEAGRALELYVAASRLGVDHEKLRACAEHFEEARRALKRAEEACAEAIRGMEL